MIDRLIGGRPRLMVRNGVVPTGLGSPSPALPGTDMPGYHMTPLRSLSRKSKRPTGLNLRAVRWTVWDWPRGGHSTWPLTATPGSGLKRWAEVPRMKAFARPTRCLPPYSPAKCAGCSFVAGDRLVLDLPRSKPRLEQPALSLSHLTWS